MSLRQRVIWIMACAVVLVAVGRFGFAQAPTPPAAAPTILSGLDVGFVVQGQNKGLATGYFEVRINGVWVPVQQVPAPGTSRIQPLSLR
jgi:hypothetical protein